MRPASSASLPPSRHICCAVPAGPGTPSCGPRAATGSICRHRNFVFLVDVVSTARLTHVPGCNTLHRHGTDGVDVSHRQEATRYPTRDRWSRQVTWQQLLGFVGAMSVSRGTGAVLAFLLVQHGDSFPTKANPP